MVENPGTTRTELIYVEQKTAAGRPIEITAAHATNLDPKHYKVEAENEMFRIVRVKYGPREASVMHEHPQLVAVIMSGGGFKMTTPDGKSTQNSSKRGDVIWSEAGKHLPENPHDDPAEVVLIELKTGPSQ
jgi:quercetin dioxygenase-like cupin family protein